MKKALLAVSAVLAVLLCSCSRNSSDYLEAVPGDAVAVVRINPAGLQKNGIDLSSLVDELNSAWNVDHDSGLPYKGIDLQSDMYGFVAPEGRSDYFIGLVFGLSDPKAFASSCSKAGRVKHDGNIDYIVDSDDVVIAWNRNSGIVAASIDGQDPDSMADLAIDLLSGRQVAGGDFASTPSCSSLMSVKGPVAGIISYSSLMDAVGDEFDIDDMLDELKDEDRKLYRAFKAWDFSDLAVLFGLSFDKDVANINFDMVSPRGYNDDILKETSALMPQIKSSALSSFQSSSQAGIAIGLSGKNILEWLNGNSDAFVELLESADEQLEELDIDARGLTLSKIVSSIDGVLTVGFNGMVDDEIPSLTATIPASGIYEKVMPIVKDLSDGDLVRSGNGWTLDIDGTDLSISKSGNDIALSLGGSPTRRGHGLPSNLGSLATGKKMVLFARMDDILNTVSDFTYDDDGIETAKRFLRRYMPETNYIVVSIGEF